MSVVSDLARRMAGGYWNRSDRADRRNWWNVDVLVDYVDSAIEGRDRDDPAPAEGEPTGVRRALVDHLGRSAPLHRGVSVGCGNGHKEISLVQAGLVEHFTLFEVSSDRLDSARERAGALGLSDSFSFRDDDAFAAEEGGFDLVYWDHSLHHMLDVDRALDWSVGSLCDGGVLVVNDYIGPNRLQWTQRDHELATATIRQIEAELGDDVRPARRKHALTRVRMILRDPSEAPQSERIMESCRRACGGWAPSPIGCALVNMCGASVARSRDPIAAGRILIRRDEEARALGESHFAFGIWTK